MENKKKSFEENLVELEQVIRNLENKNITLEEAVKNYTAGIELSKTCYEILNTNEELIIKQMTENGLIDFKKE